MPKITEQQYRDSSQLFAELYDSEKPQTTSHLLPFLRAYEKQQKDLGLPILPSEEDLKNKQFNDSVQKFDKYFGQDGLIVAEQDFNFVPEAGDVGKKTDIVSSYIDELSNTKDRNLFLYDELKIPVGKEDPNFVFERTKDHFNKIKRIKEARKLANNFAFERAIEGNTVTSITDDLRKELDREMIPVEEFDSITQSAVETSSKIYDIFAAQKESLDSVISATQRKMNSNEIASDNKTIDSFVDSLKDMPTWKRQLTFAYLDKKAKKIGIEVADQKGFWWNFGESAFRLASDMVKDEKSFEAAIDDIDAVGEVYTEVSEIKTLEDAKRYVDEQTTAKYQLIPTTNVLDPYGAQMPKSITDFIPNAKKKIITDAESELVYDAILSARKAIDVKREVSNLERNIDPLTEFKIDELSTYLPTMGKAVGSSAVVMGALGASRGAAMPALIEGYTNLNYERYRAKGYEPQQARTAAGLSGAIEASLDLLQVGYLARLTRFSGVLKGASVADVVSKRVGLKTIETGFMEVGTELVQEASPEIVGEVFSLISDEFPEVELTEEIKNVMVMAPEIAVGMFPIILLGAGLAVNADFKNARAVLSNANAMRALGIQDADVIAITDAAETNTENATTLLKEAYGRRDLTLSQEVADEIKTDRDKVRETMTIARDLGIVPTFRKVGDKFVIEKKDGTYEQVSSSGELYNRLQKEVTDGVSTRLNGYSTILSSEPKIENIRNEFQQVLSNISNKIMALETTDVDELRKLTNSPIQLTDDEVFEDAKNLQKTLLNDSIKNKKEYDVKIRETINNSREVENKIPQTFGELTNVLQVFGGSLGLTDKKITDIEDNVFGPNEIEDLKNSTRPTQYLMKLSANVETYFGKTYEEFKTDFDNIINNNPVSSNESNSYVYFLNSLKSKLDFKKYFDTKNIKSPLVYTKKIKTQKDFESVVSNLQKALGAKPLIINELEFLETQSLKDAQLSADQKNVIVANILKPALEIDSISDVSIVVPNIKGGKKTQTLKEWTDISKKIFDINVVFYRVMGIAGNKVPSALHSSSTKTIFINVATNIAPLDYLYGHEFGHYFKNNFPKVWNKIKREIFTNIVTTDEYTKYANQLDQIYKTDDIKQEEFISDYFGNKLTDLNFLQKLKESDEATFGEFVDILINFKNDVKTKADKVIASRDIKNFVSNSLLENDAFFTDALKTLKIEKTINGLQKPIPFLLTPSQAIETIKELKRIASSTKPTLEDLAFIDAISNTVTDISDNITSQNIIERSIKAIDLLQSANKPQIIQNVENGIAAVELLTEKFTNPIVKNIVTSIKNASETTSDAETNKLYDKIYPKSGIAEGDFKQNLIKYGIYKLLSNFKNKSIEEIDQISNKLNEITDSIKDGSIAEFVGGIVTDTDFALQNIATDKRTQDLTAKNLNKEKMKVNGIIHYTDTVLAFESLLSKVFPSKKKEGKTLIDPIQQIVDDIQNGFLNVNDSFSEAEGDLYNIFDVSYGFDMLQKEAGILFDVPLNPFSKARQTSIGRRAALFNFVDNNSKSAIKVSIEGKNRKLSQSFAAYILNIADQNNKLYNEQMNNKGFTPEVISEIRNLIDPKTEQIRKDIRARINKEYTKTAKTFKEVFGFSPPKPDEFFFPVIGKNKGTTIQDKFEVTYSSGKMRSGFETIDDFTDIELDLDINDQNNHLISVFYSHVYETAYQRNMFKPINKMKGILSDEKMKNSITLAYGKNTYELIMTHVLAFENNGIRSSAISQQISQGLRNAMTSVARGVMGFKLSTFFVNFMSSLNTFMDSSLPMFDIFRGYFSAITNTVTLSGEYKKTLDNPIMRRRLYQGANTLIQLSQTTDIEQKPGWWKDFGRASLQPMSKADAYAGSIAAMSAYSAHYNVALRKFKKQGLTNEKLKEAASREAETGMVRTINKTAQPTILSGKSAWELDSNPIIKTLLMFMSETRKTLGLEITEFKGAGREFMEKKYLKSLSSVSRSLFVYHLLLGTTTFAMRGIIQDFMRPEDEDDQIWNSNLWISYMLLGPLSGFPMLGSVGDSFARSMINALVELDEYIGVDVLEDKKVPIYGAGASAVLTTLDAPKSAFNKLFNLSNSETPEQDLTDVFGDGLLFTSTILNMLGIRGGDTISGVSTMKNVIEQTIKAIDAQEN